jgi:hypothetical protein
VGSVAPGRPFACPHLKPQRACLWGLRAGKKRRGISLPRCTGIEMGRRFRRSDLRPVSPIGGAGALKKSARDPSTLAKNLSPTMAHRYGYGHKRLRRRYQREVEAGLATCCRCLKPIRPDDRWHLDHAADGDGYLGPAHARCNLSADGQARAAQLYGKRPSAEATRLPCEPYDPHARVVWREWWRQTRREARGDVGPQTWSRHWGDSSEYDGRCPRCRQRGAACYGANGARDKR